MSDFKTALLELLSATRLEGIAIASNSGVDAAVDHQTAALSAFLDLTYGSLDDHRANLEATEAEARAAQFKAMEELLEAVSRHEDIPAQWLAFRDAQADHTTAAMVLDQHLFAVAADREIRKLTVKCAEQIVEHEVTKEIR